MSNNKSPEFPDILQFRQAYGEQMRYRNLFAYFYYIGESIMAVYVNKYSGLLLSLKFPYSLENINNVKQLMDENGPNLIKYGVYQIIKNQLII